MALYASHARANPEPDQVMLATLGAISAPLSSLAPGQLFIASGLRPAKGLAAPAIGQAQPMDVHNSTRQPSGQRT